MQYKNANDFYTSTPKTRASNRVIALDDDTINYLKEWKKVQEKNIVSKYVLSYSGLPLTKSGVSSIMTHSSRQAEVHRIKTHALRHSHASLLISLGENALVVRDRLGHEDIETTLGTYGHLYPNTNRQVADKLSNLIKVEENDTIEKKYITNQYIRK